MEKVTKGERTKHHLFESAIELFREKGYDNVSVGEIVKKAGTAKGTFYIYFESKAAIITQMIREYDEYYDTVAKKMNRETPVSQRLEFMVYSSCKFTEDTIGLDLIRVLYTNQLLPGRYEQDALNSNRTLYRIIHNLLAEGQENGTYQTAFDVDEMGAWLIRCIRGTFYEWCMRDGRLDLCDECIRFVRAFCRGIEFQNT